MSEQRSDPERKTAVALHTLRASEDLVIEVFGEKGDCILFLRNEHSPSGTVILPEEVHDLVECLSVARGLLAQEAAPAEPVPVDYLALARAALAALEGGEQVDLAPWGVKDLRTG